jgi:hypothetical protein
MNTDFQSFLTKIIKNEKKQIKPPEIIIVNA